MHIAKCYDVAIVTYQDQQWSYNNFTSLHNYKICIYACNCIPSNFITIKHHVATVTDLQ